MLDEYLAFATDLAIQSGQIMVESRRPGSAAFQVEVKSNLLDLVTEIDIRVERFIFDSLRRRYPSHRFIGEESVAAGGGMVVLDTDDPTWIVDPIDGTMNFTHYSPWCCVSIGLAINRQMVLGVINCPFLDRLYTAVKGGGARRNGQPIRVSGRRNIAESLIQCDLLHSYHNVRLAAHIHSLRDSLFWQCRALRCIGSACISMCLVADGAADAYFFVGLKIWDVAAGSVIIREAGGVVCSLDGSEFDTSGRSLLCAATQSLAEQISQRARQAIQESRSRFIQQ